MDQKSFRLASGKAEACFLMKRRNLTTKWTVHYRRINKKGISADEASKKRRSKTKTAVRRDISGLPMELLQKRLPRRDVPRPRPLSVVTSQVCRWSFCRRLRPLAPPRTAPQRTLH